MTNFKFNQLKIVFRYAVETFEIEKYKAVDYNGGKQWLEYGKGQLVRES